MNIIRTNKNLLKTLLSGKGLLSTEDDLGFKRNHFIGVSLSHFKLLGLTLKDIHLFEFEITDCVFEDCILEQSFFYFGTFINCDFINCSFQWSKIIDSSVINSNLLNCEIIGLDIDDVESKNFYIKNGSDVSDLRINSAKLNLQLENSFISNAFFKSHNLGLLNNLSFFECLINNSNFINLNLESESFNSSTINLNHFANCKLSDKTFNSNNKTTDAHFNTLDFQSVLISENLPFPILQNTFGINKYDIKTYIKGITSKIEYQSIFISYSTVDKDFATVLNLKLNKYGVSTFLWEKDAPGGMLLEDIMDAGIKSKDRLLFIASKNSLKSAACHFELTEGRKKQEKSWERVLFPIHIDNYLFEVKKRDIRPLEKQNEYWENITELKMLNSLSFVEQASLRDVESPEFITLITKLLRGLSSK